ncbi:MAG: hypothetical protein JWO03_1119 [Bacteroidetes bacterium]|nr:hypothetical protein [Bacteroidota bacterium]
MKDSIKTLLGIGITIGLSDRDKFVNQVSEVIGQYQQDPEKGDKWAHTLVEYLEQMRNNINLENAIQGAIKNELMPDKAHIEELTKAIKELTAELQKKKTP